MSEQEKNEKSRYETLLHERGIRKDLTTNMFVVTKCILGKRYYKSFQSIREAKHWRNTFVPSTLIQNVEIEKLTFENVWKKYCELELCTLGTSTREVRLGQISFFRELFKIPMSKMSPQVISQHILAKKAEAEKNPNGRRFSFDNEMNTLRAIFSWYREEIDFKFVNPILKKHKKLGRIKEKSKRDKKMEPEELVHFLRALSEKPFWYDFAMIQLAFAARVQEIAGLQKANIDLLRNQLTIKDVVVWSRSTRKFVELKSCPKNGEVRTCFMTARIREIIERRMNDSSSDCGYVFQIDGEPVSYRTVQHHYNHALKKCGLLGKYSATHFMRHTMATITRYVTGSLESVQAVTGHKDQRLVQHYAALSTEVQRNALEQVEDFLIKKENSCEQLRANSISGPFVSCAEIVSQ